MRSKQDFLNSLSDGRLVYYRGRKVSSITDHPVLKIAASHASKLYDIDRATYDEESKQEISRYYVRPKNSTDLLERHRLVYETTMRCNGVFNIVQAIGSDALFALRITSRKVDRKCNTHYSERVEEYYRHVSKNDLAVTVAQTDVKGNRKGRPHEQEDPDMYVRVLSTSDSGIVVTGAKAHTTQSAVADEIIVLPTRAMTDKDASYSLAFAIPAHTPGLKLIVRPIDEVEGNTSAILSREDYEFETLTIFDHVHVPWSRVFLFQEYDFAGALAQLFATFHRFTAISYRAATSNLYLGTANLVAKSNGIRESPQVRDELVSILTYKELMRMSAIAAAHTHLLDEGIAVPNPLYTNIGKLYSNQNFPLVVSALVDIAGGIIATMPSAEDVENEEERHDILKYLRGADEGQKRTKILQVAKELAASSFAGYMMTLMSHAEGSVQASKLALLRDYDLTESEKLVERLIHH